MSEIEMQEATAEEQQHEEKNEGKQERRNVVLPPCQIAVKQAPIQAFLRPGMWLPGLRNLHMAKETWLMQATLDESWEKLLEGLENVASKLNHVHKEDKSRHYVEIFFFTAGCNWLDVVEINLRTGNDPGTTIGEAVSFSSGFLPAWFPLAFLCNMCCCCIPFSGNGQNTKRLEDIRSSIKVDITITAETKCNCCPS